MALQIIGGRGLRPWHEQQWSDCIIDKIIENLEIVQFIATALKSIPKLVEMQIWERNVVKCARYDPIKFANFVNLQIDTPVEKRVSKFKVY